MEIEKTVFHNYSAALQIAEAWHPKAARERERSWLEAEVVAPLSCSLLPSASWIFHSDMPHQMRDDIYSLQICLSKQKQGWNKESGTWAVVVRW